MHHRRLGRVSASPTLRRFASDPEWLEPRRLLAADPAVMLRSAIVSTEIDAAGNPSTAAVVGELVTHRLTLEIPAGTFRDSALEVALDEALGYAEVVSVAPSSPSLSVSGSLAPSLAPDGRSLVFALGTIVNPGLDAAPTETIEFTLRTVVRNVATAREAAGASTTARFTHAGRVDPLLAVSPPVVIREPRIDVAATVRFGADAPSGSVGDPVTFELRINGVAGSPTAHEVDVAWPLPRGESGSLVAAPTLTVVDTAGLVTSAAFRLDGGEAEGWTLRTVAGAAFDVGGDAGRRITVALTGSVAATILPGDTTRTAATVRWTSLPGERGPRTTDPASRERSGAGGVDDFRIVSLADFRAVDFGLTLAVVATSESTGGGRATIGEIVRQRVVAAVPEGGISSASARVRVELPPGLAFVDDGSARVALVSDGGLSASHVPAAGGTHVVGGTAVGVVPTRPLPAAAVLGDPGGFIDGGDVIFEFGVLANDDGDANDEFIVLEFNALVTNGPGNVVLDGTGTDLVSRARVIVDGFPLFATATDVITVAEGAVAWITGRTTTPGGGALAAGPFARGSRVGQVVEFAAASGPARAVLHDLRVTADLPAGVMLVPGSVRVAAGEAPAAFVDASTGQRLDLTIASLAPGALIAVAYDVEVAGDATAGSTLVIPLTVRGSTLPGTAGTPGNPTGSTAPGAAGTGTGERDGSGGINVIRGDASSRLLVTAVVPSPPEPPPPPEPPLPPPPPPQPAPPGIIVTAADIGAMGQPRVTVVDRATGQVRSTFLAYEVGFRGGVRLAVGDVDGDGQDDVVTAPGPGRVGEVRVFRQDGVELPAFRTLAFGRGYRGGVELAVGDVTGDGWSDLVTAASRGPGDIRVFAITPPAVDPVANQPVRAFRALQRHAIGGATVATADIGIFSGGVLIDAQRRDGRMEIVVGSGAGSAALVAIYDVSVTPVVVRSWRPLPSALYAGVAVAAGRYDDDAVDDIIVSAGRRGGSTVEVWSTRAGSPQPVLLAQHRAFAELSRTRGSIFVVGIDDSGDGRIDSLLAVEGQGGGDRGLRRIWGGVATSGLSTPMRGPIRIAASRPRG